MANMDRPYRNLFVTGDSTSGLNPPSEKTGEKVGWADVFCEELDPGRIHYWNRAMPGYSLRDYHQRGILENILSEVIPGDVILACHGHLEGAPLVRDSYRAHGSLPGIGEEVEIVRDTHFPEKYAVHTVGWYLRHFYTRCRERKATVVFLSPPVRGIWEGGKIKRTKSTTISTTMKLACFLMNADFFDFAEATENYLNQLGQMQGSKLYLADDFVHTNLAGARAYGALLKVALSSRFPHIFL